jgi:hypothetical protein
MVNEEGGNATAGKYYILMDDIDLSGYPNWTPIGIDWWKPQMFQGIFDGNGKVVSNLKINCTDNYGGYLGLFGAIQNATVKNLGVINCNIKSSGQYKDCIGGLIGVSESSTISNCYSTGNVTVTGNWCYYVGGLIGYFQEYHNPAILIDCYSTATVSNTYNSTGGLVGLNDGGEIRNCYATGNVTAVNSGNHSVGGLVGFSGYGNPTISNCYATGMVSGEQRVGGLVGKIEGDQTIYNCYATGMVSGGIEVGGLVGNYDVGYSGNATSIIQNCVAANLSITGTNYVNRIAGNTDGNFQNNYANEDMLVNGSTRTGTLTDANGANISLTTLKSLNFYNTPANWNATSLWSMADEEDNTKIWRICEGETLPFFQWEEGIECTPAPTTHTVTLTADPEEGGSVEGGGIFEEGTMVVITATPADCYEFVEWQDSEGVFVSEGDISEFELVENVELVAVFAKISYELTLTANEGGEVSGADVYNCGEEVTAPAIADGCYEFVEWQDVEGEVVSTENPYIFDLTENVDLFAIFELETFELTLIANEGGEVSGADVYNCGEEVTARAIPDGCYNFVEWQDAEGVFVSDENPYSFDLVANVALVAVFELQTYELTLTANEGGEVSGADVYNCGEEVTARAIPDGCYNFEVGRASCRE